VPAASVALGDIVKETHAPGSSNRPIATRDDVVFSQNGQLVDFSLSHVVKNDFDKWKSLLNPDIGDAGYKVVVREEWSKDRSIEYVKAALQVKAVRESLKGEKPTFYAVTGVIRGAKAADSDLNERSEVLGFKCRKVSVMQPSGEQTDGTRLIVEQVEARSWSQSKGVKLTPTVAEELLSEIDVESSRSPQLEMEQKSKKPGDTPQKTKVPKRGIRKAAKNFGCRAENAVKVISIMGRLTIDQIAGHG
jgi:hypothetical protein